MKAITLKARNLVKIYSKRTVVDNVSLEVKQGEIVGLLGPNGAGKTTTFYMITGMIDSNEGEIYLDNDDISDLPMYKRARLGIGYLPQEASIFRKMSVYDNIYSVLEFMNLEADERDDKTRKLMKDFGIEQISDSIGYLLSGPVKEEEPKLPVQLQQIPNLFCSMNLLQELIPLPWKIL